MAILDAASVQDRKRLLELFPIAKLREAWPSINGTKDEVCHAVAEQQPIDEVVTFVDDHVSCCKQHVYVYEHGSDAPALPASITDGEMVLEVSNDHALFITRSVNRVVLRNPLEETTLEFLWPIRIEIAPPHVVIRLVVLEKNIGSYFERPYYVGDRGIDEKSILEPVVNALALSPCDLHKGVKKLWGDGFMDSHRTKYKKPISLASEAMDEELGIRENNPDLYEVLIESPLYNTLFIIPPEKGLTVSTFSVDPSRGAIAFPRYSEKVGDTDFVVREILKNN